MIFIFLKYCLEPQKNQMENEEKRVHESLLLSANDFSTLFFKVNTNVRSIHHLEKCTQKFHRNCKGLCNINDNISIGKMRPIFGGI